MRRIFLLSRLANLPLLLCLLLFVACGDNSTGTDNNGDTDQEEEPDTTTTETVNGVELELLAENMTAPVALAAPDDGSGRLFIADQTGLIRVIDQDGNLLEEPFLDLRDQMVSLNSGYDERGLLGLAFHPEYETNGRFFVYYSAPLQEDGSDGWDHTSHLAEFTASSPETNQVDAASENILMQIDQPQGNHNGSTLAFGPDGYLYISLGDGGGGNDTGNGHAPDWYEENAGGNGQDITENLLGSILRIDVDGGAPYEAPGDNPFVGTEGLDEIYAYGLRNPYRFSFDAGGSNELIAADVGQVLWEEINVIENGGNYGWNVKEGSECFNADDNSQPLNDCPNSDTLGTTLTDPVIEMQTGTEQEGGDGQAIIGGYVYRGEQIPGLDGEYVFGMWSVTDQPEGTLYAAERNNDSWDFRELEVQNGGDSSLGHYLLAVGQDQQGELYLLTTDNSGPSGETGRVYRVNPQ